MLDLDLYVCCLDTLMSRSLSLGPNNLYVYDPLRKPGRGLLEHETGLIGLSNLLLTVPRRRFCCGLF